MNSNTKKPAPAKQDKLEKLKNALHPISKKKVEVIYTATDNCLFYITDKQAIMPVERSEIVQSAEYFVTADEFQKIYLKSIESDMKNLKGNVDAQVRHIENHILNQNIEIDRDMTILQNFLIESVKKMVETYKAAIKKRYQTNININLEDLLDLQADLGSMEKNGKSLMDNLTKMIKDSDEFTEENKQKVQDQLTEIQ
jgi:hypothetical protein